jgi:hypothetical protein
LKLIHPKISLSAYPEVVPLSARVTSSILIHPSISLTAYQVSFPVDILRDIFAPHDSEKQIHPVFSLCATQDIFAPECSKASFIHPVFSLIT